MKEFEFTVGSLEAQGLHVGDMVECTYSNDTYFTVGSIYAVRLSDYFSCLSVTGNFGDIVDWGHFVKFKPVSKKTKKPDFQNALDYLDTFGIPAEITDKGMHVEGELTKVQWLDFAKILLEGGE